MRTTLTMIYWKGDSHWLGTLKERPDIMTQGSTIEELEENLKDAYRLMAGESIPEDHLEKTIAL